jgi:hypothetical protein
VSFENLERYRRKPDIIHAVRLTADGNVPIMHADTDWIKKARTDGRLSHSPGGWFANTGIALQAAYGGDWLVLHDATAAVEVLRDDEFRARYEAIPFAEDE